MEMESASSLLSALGQATRLKVVALLAEHRPAGLPASRVADLAGTPRNTMSGHLGILSNAGIVTSSRSGRTITYRINDDLLADLLDLISEFAASKKPTGAKRG